MEGRSIQTTVKEVCSITYVSDKLGVSRPTLYKYMDMYDAGLRERIPSHVTAFFDFLTSARRSEDDAILYFINGRSKAQDPVSDDDRGDSECLVGGGRAMFTFPWAEDPSSVTVEVLVKTGSGFSVIGEYRPDPGKRYVTVDDLVPGNTFYYRVRPAPDGAPSTDPRPFEIAVRRPPAVSESHASSAWAHERYAIRSRDVPKTGVSSDGGVPIDECPYAPTHGVHFYNQSCPACSETPECVHNNYIRVSMTAWYICEHMMHRIVP